MTQATSTIALATASVGALRPDAPGAAGLATTAAGDDAEFGAKLAVHLGQPALDGKPAAHRRGRSTSAGARAHPSSHMTTVRPRAATGPKLATAHGTQAGAAPTPTALPTGVPEPTSELDHRTEPVPSGGVRRARPGAKTVDAESPAAQPPAADLPTPGVGLAAPRPRHGVHPATRAEPVQAAACPTDPSAQTPAIAPGTAAGGLLADLDSKALERSTAAPAPRPTASVRALPTAETSPGFAVSQSLDQGGAPATVRASTGEASAVDDVTSSTIASVDQGAPAWPGREPASVAPPAPAATTAGDEPSGPAPAGRVDPGAAPPGDSTTDRRTPPVAGDGPPPARGDVGALEPASARAAAEAGRRDPRGDRAAAAAGAPQSPAAPALAAAYAAATGALALGPAGSGARAATADGPPSGSTAGPSAGPPSGTRAADRREAGPAAVRVGPTRNPLAGQPDATAMPRSPLAPAPVGSDGRADREPAGGRDYAPRPATGAGREPMGHLITASADTRSVPAAPGAQPVAGADGARTDIALPAAAIAGGPAPLGPEPIPGQTGGRTHFATVGTPVVSPQFPAALSEQVAFSLREGLSHVELNLTPTELGPVRIEMTLDGAQASISFACASADTRAAIEQSLSTLRDMLGREGVSLAQTDVGSGFSDRQGDPDARGATARERVRGSADPSATPAESHAPEPTPRGAGVRRGAIDLFA